MRAIFAGLALVALVSGCSDKGADANGDGKITNEEAKAEMASGGAIEMKPGEYEITTSFTEFSAPSMPAQAQEMMKGQMAKGSTVKTCLTEEQVKNPGADFVGAQKDNCTFNQFDRSGGTMTVDMVCTMGEGMKMASKMHGSFAPESYEMTLDTRMSGMPGGEMAMKGTIKGRRIGDCPAG